VKVLLTGGSSFSGLWIATALAEAGHEVTAPLLRPRETYDGLRGRRVEALARVARLEPGMAFGDDAFRALVSREPFDVLCHHGARVEGYKELTFDVAGALADNTRNIGPVLAAMAERGLQAMIGTGSVFESDEGAGETPREAFSPYGLSKRLTHEVIRFWSRHAGVRLGKFVIANPFGPFEEPRFCAYLMKTWAAGKVAAVNTPAYLRDNIHVGLLGRAYAGYLDDIVAGRGAERFGPMGYVESQGQFAQRFANAMRQRTGLACELALADQREFAEPLVRINTDRIDPASYGWNETEAWDAIAGFYRDGGGN